MALYYNTRALPLNEWKFDSFRIRLGPNQWKLTDKAIEQNQFGYFEEVSRTNKLTGETFTEEQWIHSNLKRWKEDETKSSVKYNILKDNLFGIEEGSLEIHINSKLLKGLYFYGVTAGTIPLIYRNIINEGFVDISFSDFLNSHWQDLDITKDLIVQNPLEVMRTGKKLTKPSQLPYCVVRQTMTTTSVAWGTRQETSKRSKTKTYLKFYHKPSELTTNSYPFYKEHLLPTLSAGAEDLFGESEHKPNIELPEGLIRVEFNIYRSSELNSWGFQEPKTLKELLLFLSDQAKVQSLFKKIRDSKMKPRLIQHNPEELSPSQIPIEFTLETLVRENDFRGMGKHQRAANYFLDACFPSPVRKQDKPKRRNLSNQLDKVALILDGREDVGKQLQLDVYNQSKSLGILP